MGRLLTPLIGWRRRGPDPGRSFQNHPDSGSEELALRTHTCAFQNQPEAAALRPGQGRKGGLQAQPIRRGHAGSRGNLVHLCGQGAQVKRDMPR